MKRIAVFAAVLGLLAGCRNNPPTWEKSQEYAGFCAILEELQMKRDSLFNLSESLPEGTDPGEVLRLMDERLRYDNQIARVKRDRDEAERMFYLKQAARR